MHRLKKWFGIKDVDGPEPKQLPSEVSTESDTTKSHNPGQLTKSQTVSDAGTNSSVGSNYSSTTVAVPTIVRPENESLYNKYNMKIETWLRQYIPVKKNECAQCKLVAATFLGSVMASVVYLSYKQEQKKPWPKHIRPFYFGMLISFSGVCVLNLYHGLRKTRMFSEKLEGERQHDFYKRHLKEESEKCKRFFEKIENLLKGTSDVSETPTKTAESDEK